MAQEEEDEPTPCWICLETDGDLITPCNCRGSISKVHQECLVQWLSSSVMKREDWDVCNHCKEKYRLPDPTGRLKAVWPDDKLLPDFGALAKMGGTFSQEVRLRLLSIVMLVAPLALLLVGYTIRLVMYASEVALHGIGKPTQIGLNGFDQMVISMFGEGFNITDEHEQRHGVHQVPRCPGAIRPLCAGVGGRRRASAVQSAAIVVSASERRARVLGSLVDVMSL